ncbi:MAG: HNH/ENDO VII family nuclease, partial [Tannerella sp.]|nr:HNH/ENDO VII family nuclease [Tannerella sp.]
GTAIATGGGSAAATAAKTTGKIGKELIEEGLEQSGKKALKELGEEGVEKAGKELAEEGTEKLPKVITKPKSLREQYLGRTPGKNSKTGREVFDRMLKEEPPTARIVKDKYGKEVKEFLDDSSNPPIWRNISEADMGHINDAVSWWNKEGRKYGAKSDEVREWMLDSKNYKLEYYKTNRSKGAKLGQTETYMPPL